MAEVPRAVAYQQWKALVCSIFVEMCILVWTNCYQQEQVLPKQDILPHCIQHSFKNKCFYNMNGDFLWPSLQGMGVILTLSELLSSFQLSSCPMDHSLFSPYFRTATAVRPPEALTVLSWPGPERTCCQKPACVLLSGISLLGSQCNCKGIERKPCKLYLGVGLLTVEE